MYVMCIDVECFVLLPRGSTIRHNQSKTEQVLREMFFSCRTCSVYVYCAAKRNEITFTHYPIFLTLLTVGNHQKHIAL